MRGREWREGKCRGYNGPDTIWSIPAEIWWRNEYVDRQMLSTFSLLFFSLFWGWCTYQEVMVEHLIGGLNLIRSRQDVRYVSLFLFGPLRSQHLPLERSPPPSPPPSPLSPASSPQALMPIPSLESPLPPPAASRRLSPLRPAPGAPPPGPPSLPPPVPCEPPSGVPHAPPWRAEAASANADAPWRLLRSLSAARASTSIARCTAPSLVNRGTPAVTSWGRGWPSRSPSTRASSRSRGRGSYSCLPLHRLVPARPPLPPLSPPHPPPPLCALPCSLPPSDPDPHPQPSSLSQSFHL